MILNIFKPIGCTSFHVVKNIRRIVNDKKVGHGGTLDPFADGVLIIGTGKDTKKLSNIIREIVGYRGKIVFNPNKPDGTMRKLINSQKIIKLGFRPKVKLKEG